MEIEEQHATVICAKPPQVFGSLQRIAVIRLAIS
jgi:hypothetical protein